MRNSTIIIEVLKHMPGKHNQDLHAGKRGEGSHKRGAHAGSMSDFVGASVGGNPLYGMDMAPFPMKHPNLMKRKGFSPQGIKDMLDKSETMIDAMGMDADTKKETMDATRTALEQASFFPTTPKVQAVVDRAKQAVIAGGVKIADVDIFEDNGTFVGQLGMGAAFSETTAGESKAGMVILGPQIAQTADKSISDHMVAHEFIHGSDRPNRMSTMNQGQVAGLEEPITELLTIRALKKAGQRSAASAGIGEVYQTNVALLARAVKAAGVEPGRESTYLRDMHQNGYDNPLGHRILAEMETNQNAMQAKLVASDLTEEAAEKALGEHISKREYYQLLDAVVNKALPMNLDITYALYIWYLDGKISESRNLAAKLGKTAELRHMIGEMRLNFIRCRGK